MPYLCFVVSEDVRKRVIRERDEKRGASGCAGREQEVVGRSIQVRGEEGEENRQIVPMYFDQHRTIMAGTRGTITETNDLFERKE